MMGATRVANYDESQLQDFLQQCRCLTDSELDHALPPETEVPATLHQAMRYAVFGGGKRLRPAVCMAAAGWAGSALETARPAAAALELLHTYTLVHDDLPCMDDDALRRGRATTHMVFGEATALLAGDALLTLAFEWLARGGGKASVSSALQVCALAAAAGSRGVVGGQVDDLEGEGRHPDWQVVSSIHARKTAALFRVAAVLGGLAANAGQARIDALAVYGHELGMAFQIADDLLNRTASEAVLGKPVGSDRDRGKLTAVAALGESGARATAHRHADAAVSAIQPFGQNSANTVLNGLAKLSVERSH